MQLCTLAITAPRDWLRIVLVLTTTLHLVLTHVCNTRSNSFLSLISLWEKFLVSHKGVKWKFKCLVGVAYLLVPALWKEICTIPMDKKV